MFGVEDNAKRAGKQAEQRALANGTDPKAAARWGRRVQEQITKQANEWVQENVGLD